MPTVIDARIIAEVSERLGLPQELVRIFSCPVCKQKRFAGMLGAGSIVKVRCARSSCAHHLPASPWIVHVSGAESERLRVHRCPSPLCKNPCQIRAPHMQSDQVKYDNGKPVCNWTWCCGYFAPGTRIVAWCKESSCVNYAKGFTIVS